MQIGKFSKKYFLNIKVVRKEANTVRVKLLKMTHILFIQVPPALRGPAAACLVLTGKMWNFNHYPKFPTNKLIPFSVKRWRRREWERDRERIIDWFPLCWLPRKIHSVESSIPSYSLKPASPSSRGMTSRVYSNDKHRCNLAQMQHPYT